jgi:hypothetical protein
VSPRESWFACRNGNRQRLQAQGEKVPVSVSACGKKFSEPERPVGPAIGEFEITHMERETFEEIVGIPIATLL